MDSDFKTAIIELMQHPTLLEKTFDTLTEEEIGIYYDLLSNFLMETDNECLTLVDPLQKARLCFNLAQVCEFQGDLFKSNRYFQTAFSLLVKGGFDLSMKKWLELVSLRIRESNILPDLN